MENREVKISVRNLVEFVLRAGNLDSRFTGSSRALEGTRAHQKLQKSKGEEYEKEVALKHKFEYKEFLFNLEGRADGIIHEGDYIVIDEIKSTTYPLELINDDYNLLHWAQAKCYAYIYLYQKELEQIEVQLSYFHLDSEQVKYIRRGFTKGELEEFFFGLIDRYLIWANYTRDWVNIRDEAIKSLGFPFENYRKGQRELAVAVYKTVIEEKKLFANAPTGTGKTISTLFPAIKAIGEGKVSKIFYLTAKTIARSVAEEAVILMKNKGLKIKTITLTAKEKICFKEKAICNPEKCEYAKGHFDRVNDAILETLQCEDIITREIVEKYSIQHKVCPFEFSLDLSLFADCVICDYNYVFDPRVNLKRFFAESGDKYVFLIDEAHNLVDRARDMFSAEIYKKPILEMKRIMKDKDKKLSNVLTKINSAMIEAKKQCNEEDHFISKEENKEIYGLLRKFTTIAEEWLLINEGTENYEQLLEMYFNALNYLRISELYDERFVTYVEKTKEDVKIKLFCLDPSKLLKESIEKGNPAIFFSATLTPMEYFKAILGGDLEDYSIRLTSPFDTDNRAIMVLDNVKTKFTYREKSYDVIADYINGAVKVKQGNYMVFFPSYSYMREVSERFKTRYDNINTIIQEPSMTEEQREEFLKNFDEKSKTTLVGFGVLGGIFSEGVDLKGDRLIGAIIVGVGLPQLCLERDIIRDYFNDTKEMGYEYAYMYPGMNKVLQAAGRVIRSEDDKGIIMLIDERFSSRSYQSLFPKEWFPNLKIKEMKSLKQQLRIFWGNK
ncbi:ATP-dependent DNA helicase [Clostridium omnivorum]|uniref:ATP-dependent helicase n=1 Tax=Clostridium omnivorum TaxID=1604902 RepID=A0ABQ5N1X6_9CLOT|nr:ATP-dependent DNA helicase [Clostridium sp. E14]GLC29194.1 ATP-dependent helicase [Clostridium sp. E14]